MSEEKVEFVKREIDSRQEVWNVLTAVIKQNSHNTWNKFRMFPKQKKQINSF